MSVLFFVVVFSNVFVVFTQQQVGRQFFNRDGSYNRDAPSNSDVDYRTFIYNNRRYGQSSPVNPETDYSNSRNPYNPSPYNPSRYNPIPYNPNFNNPLDGINNVQPGFPFLDPNNRYDQTGIQLPGILGGWRPDIQGKQRPDSPRQETDRDVLVTTTFGQIQGFRVYLYDNPLPESGYRPEQSPVERVQANVSVFLGIPYAQPPVNEGRFRPPRAHPGWQIVQAVDFGPACPQPSRYTGATKGIRDVHEDCLYLNIYTPTTVSGLAHPYPVMFHIHGGEFMHGASNLFPGHVMAAFYQVVVVSINYRLGPLGFLSTGDESSPGNYGILDQAMALRWVYDNIQFFNGDRHSITLFGPGAGAASAGLLMVNPRTSFMVNRVIAQSGSALADWALILDHWRAENTSKVFAQHMGCSIENSYKIVDCLKRGRSFLELGNAEFQPQVGTFPWGPVLDKGFKYPGNRWYEGWKTEDWVWTNDTTEELIRKKKYNRGLSYMTGVTTQEAAHFISNNETLSPHFDIDEEWFDNKVKELVFRYNYTLNPDGIYRAIKYRYTYWPDPYNHTHIREQYIDLLSDMLYRAPVDAMEKLLVEQRVPVFKYVLNTTVEALRLPQWRQYPHDIEHLFLTGAPFMDTEFFPSKLRLEKFSWTDNDRNMSHFFMKAFTDFARYGNPSHTQILGLYFEVATHGSLKYLNLNTTYNSSILLNYRQTESAFWTWYLPTVIGILVPTYPPTTEWWWEPREPLQIAFWSVTGINLLLIVVAIILCMLWRNARRGDRYFSGDVLMLQEEPDSHPIAGIENKSESAANIYEYRDSAPSNKGGSMSSIGNAPSTVGRMSSLGGRGSMGSLGGGSERVTLGQANGDPRMAPRTPPPQAGRNYKRHNSATVPMTQV